MAKKLILASASPRRKELLDQTGVSYQVTPSDYDESGYDFSGDLFSKSERLALLKAKTVADQIVQSDTVIVGADTIVISDGLVFGKPKDRSEAFRMLRTLSGRSHFVITGLAAIDKSTGQEYKSHEITKVVFRHLTDDEINEYLDSEEFIGKAGAYAIQGNGALLVEKIDGCFYNVVGLPLLNLHKLLIKAGHTGLMRSNNKERE